MLTYWQKIVVLLTLLICGTCLAAASITSTSGNVIYVDSSSNVHPNLLGNYVSYTVTNDTGSPIADAWATIGSFSGSYINLALHESGTSHIGPLAAGDSKTIFFYLSVNCSLFSAGQCNVNTPQTFSVNLYSGPPSANLLASQQFSATVLDTTNAQANKVNTVVTSTNDPTLGSLITVTVTGSTGTIGSAKIFYASPETTYDFPADIFRLYNTSVTFSGSNTGTYNNQLLIPTSAFSSTASTNYSFVATYLVVGTTATTTAVSPVAFISSGTQMKHTDTSSYASFSPIPPASNTVALSKLASTSILPLGGTLTYTLRATNSGNADVTLDDFVDTLPTVPATVAYVPGSSTYAGSPIADPTISGGNLTWTGMFGIPANGTADLTFQATIPNTPGTYTNSAVAHVTSSQIDTSLSTGDAAPATVPVGVGTPILAITSSHNGNFTQGQTAATYTITVSNVGSVATIGVISITDTLPAGLTATSISGSGWTCDLATLTCTRPDALAAGTSFPVITVTVNVAANAPASLTNTVSASGGAANPASATDATVVTQLPVLAIASTHVGSFTQGQNGAAYTLTVSNSGPAATSGTVTVADTLPAGITATAISGSGWTCTLATLTCTRADALAAAGSYPAITITVNIAANAAASLTNSVTASGGGATNPATATDVTAVTQLPILAVTSTHTGSFTQGQTAATYTITVSNIGTGATSGVISITDTLPAGLTATAISGSGWTCDLATLTCTRPDSLAAGASFPVITITVNVAANAAASLTNSVTASGGGATNPATTSDVTAVTQLPILAVTSTHTGSFTQGQTAATYTITVSNIGTGATSGVISIADTLPAGLTATAISGSGWTCDLATLTCTRPDSLAAGASFPVITITVNVAANAAAALTNSVTASGGGAANSATATDATTINQLPVLSVNSAHLGDFVQGQAGASYTLTVGNTGTGATSGTVTVVDTLPAGLTVTAISGSGWTCNLATLTCTRADALAAAANYPSITLSVNVALNAAASLNNSVTASGGGAVSNATATDVTLIDKKAPDATTTTLALTPGNSVNAGVAVTLTATVTAVGSPVYPGVVEFCDASASTCAGPAVFATAQLRSDGTATERLTLGAGTYSIKAVFLGTPYDLTSESPSQSLLVAGTGGYASATTIAASGATGSYSLTGTVKAFGKPVPTGTVSFLDTTNGNANVGSAALDPSTLSYTVAPTAAASTVSGLPFWLASADFNNDGNIDLVVPNGTSNSVSVLLGAGDGTFATAQSFATQLNSTSYAVAVGDFNADGNPDLVITNLQGAPSVSVLLGNGDGTFQPQVSYSTGNAPNAVAVADINGDGDADLVVVNRDDSSVSVLLGNGDGTFQAQTTYTVGTAPMALSIADLNEDGVADLVVTNSSDNTVSVLLGNGDGSFQSQVIYTVGHAPVAVSTADLNGDGHVDVVLANRDDATIGVLLGSGDGTLQPQVTYAANNSPVSLAVADLNGDSRTDVVVSNNTDNNVSVLVGKGDGTFKPAVAFAAGASPYGVVAADFNGDGLADIATVSNTAAGTITVLLSQHVLSATAPSVSLGVGSHDVLASYPGDADHEASQSNTIHLAGAPLTNTTTTLTVSPNPVTAGQSVTLTASVSPTPTGPSLGTISFYNGATLLGSATINASGVATLSVSNLAAGSYTGTASYSGNAAFNPSTSAPVTLTVQAPAVYTVSASQTPYTVIAGKSVNIPVNVAPLGGSFNSMVTMSATGLPPGATVSFIPATVQPGTTGATTMMTIHTTTQSASARPVGERLFPYAPVSLAACLFVAARRRKELRSALMCLLMFVIIGTGVLGSTSCSGGFAGKRQSHTYVVTVTGTSGSLHPSTTVTVIVQ